MFVVLYFAVLQHGLPSAATCSKGCIWTLEIVQQQKLQLLLHCRKQQHPAGQAACTSPPAS
jgi:hypothetical protein